jgi:hypothetical protein
MRKLNKKRAIRKKEIIAVMALTVMFTITGCKNIGTIDGRTGTPVTEVDNNGDSDSKNEDTSIIYDKGDIIMKAEKETYSNKVEEIRLTIENNSSYEYYYGEEFSLEQQIDGEWVLVSPKEEIFVIEIANILESNGSNTFISPLRYYNELSDGHYRIVKSIVKANTSEDESTDQTEKFLLAAEFDIDSEVGESSRLAPVYVSVDKEIYSDKKDVIKYTIVNNTNETKSVVLAPIIEKEVGDGWEYIKCENGYCGVPDSLEKKIDGEINLEWLPSINDGVYRVSFDLEEDKGKTTRISALFSFKEELITSAGTKGKEDTTDWKQTNYTTVNNFNDVTMSVKKDTLSANGLTAMFQNNSDKTCLYGEQFVLEKKIGEQWYEVPVAIKGNYGFNAIGYEVPSEGKSEWEVDWKWVYGSLDAGEYRIIKDVSDFRKTGDFDTYYLTAEFTLSN